MAIASAGYSVTMRLELPPEPNAMGQVAVAVSGSGGAVTALDVVESRHDRLVVDLTCNATGSDHVAQLQDAVEEVDGVRVRKVSDRTFLLHLGGKIEVRSRLALRTRDELAMAYTPGVARVCRAIAEKPEDARRLTIKRNTVAVVTDGSAVLGLGDLGPAAALPVMEGKAALFKRLAGVDAWPVCLDTTDVDEIVRTVQVMAPVFGGVNLEDIAAPRCFEVERRLRDVLDIPVFHDDQHGTAVVVLAALLNALRVVGKELSEVEVVVSGAGAAGSAVVRLLVSQGCGSLVVFDRDGCVHAGRDDDDETLRWLAENTNAEGFSGSLAEAVRGADVFLGLSVPDLLTEDDVAGMADDAVVFALANPDPEIDPSVAGRHAAVVATGRSDYPNQINNVLVFPGFFRGLLDAAAVDVTEEMEVAAAQAIAATVSPEELNASYIVPSVFDDRVAEAVARAVREAVREAGMSALPEEDDGDDGVPTSDQLPATATTGGEPTPGG